MVYAKVIKLAQEWVRSMYDNIADGCVGYLSAGGNNNQQYASHVVVIIMKPDAPRLLLACWMNSL